MEELLRRKQIEMKILRINSEPCPHSHSLNVQTQGWQSNMNSAYSEFQDEILHPEMEKCMFLQHL